MNDKLLNTILAKIVTIEDTVSDTSRRVQHVEDIQTKLYDKLDGFLALIQRHETELASLRSAYERLEQRITRLERQKA